MEALIALIAFTVIGIAGIVGLINPSKVKLKNRWQAVTVLSAFIPTIGILMVLFPGTPQPPQTPAEMKNAGAGLIAIWFVIVGSIFALRYMIARSQSLEAARLSLVAPERQTPTSKFDPTASPKVGIMRSVTSAMDSSLKERIVAEIKLMPNVATLDESAIAHTHHVTPALVKTLADKARLGMLGVYFDEALTAQTLDKANAVKFARTLGLSDNDLIKAGASFRKSKQAYFSME